MAIKSQFFFIKYGKMAEIWVYDGNNCELSLPNAWRPIREQKYSFPLNLDTRQRFTRFVKKSMRIGNVVVAHWVGCVCNQSWHVLTCLSNSWHRLRVAAFAQLAVVGRGNNTCVYVIAIFTMCESTENAFASSFVLKLEKPQRKRINYCSKHTVKMQWVVHKCLVLSI